MEYNDYELVSLAQENNEEAINILHKKYKDIINTKSKKIYSYLKNTGIELSDVIQEATIGFEEAIAVTGAVYTSRNDNERIIHAIRKMIEEKKVANNG